MQQQALPNLRDHIMSSRLLTQVANNHRRAALEHLDLVREIVDELRRKALNAVPEETLMLYGVWGLHLACVDYEPHCEMAFMPYARYRVRASILDYLQYASKPVRAKRTTQRSKLVNIDEAAADRFEKKPRTAARP